MTADTIVYQAVHRMPWAERSNLSNIAGAAVDSAVFCAGLGFPFIVAFGQFTAKVAGGVLFVLLLERSSLARTLGSARDPLPRHADHPPPVLELTGRCFCVSYAT
jgi:uncharacterized PurR-regulated membrane protein YhhQ (DUF165 family)